MSNVIKGVDTTGSGRPVRKFEMEEIVTGCEEAVESARETAERVIDEATGEAERIRDEAYRQGWEAGKREVTEATLAQALIEARQRYAEQIERLVGALEKVVRELETRRESVIKATRDDLVRLAMKIARMVVKKEVAVPGEVARLNLEEAIELSAKRTELLALVNEQDLQVLESVVGDLTRRLGVGGSVRLVADPEVMPGGCLVRSVRGEVDATTQTQMGEIERSLLGE